MKTTVIASICAASLLLLLPGCAGQGDDSGPTDSESDTDTDTDTDTDSDTDTDPGDGYAYLSRDGQSDSVDVAGQVFRHLLIVDMKSHLGEMTERIDSGWSPAAGEVREELEFYFEFDSDSAGSVSLLYSTDPAPAQATYDEVSTGKDLVSKVAGNDATGQHQDWSTAFVGWSDPAVTTPESLLRLWFDQLDSAAVARGNGDIPLAPDGTPVAALSLTAEGLDLQQLTQKFLLASVAFSQGSDDYLDDDVDGSGLLASHVDVEEGKPYTALEHAWDEAWGYFGACRDYGNLGDDVVADPGYADTWTPDGSIDLLTEVCWGHSTNAAKRDLGAVAATDYSGEAWDAFRSGRSLLASTATTPTAAELAELQGYRDAAVAAWEAAIAASVVHYINGSLEAMAAFGTDDYDFASHAKAWSEMKGFALSFQFNPRSPLSDADFALLHDLLGQAPVLPGADETTIAEYKQALRDARALLGDSYGFDAANLGDDDGQGGW